jgi:oligopeptide/dipeptide ABC transporter ATP-binding protein
MAPPLLELDDLHVEIRARGGVIHAVQGVSLELRQGEALALVGESGCGKTMTLRAILGLLPPTASIPRGRVVFGGRALTGACRRELQAVRGAGIGMVFQEPMTALNPVMRVGHQVREVILAHSGLSRKEADARTVELLQLVGIPHARRRSESYPHQFSGGLRQRVMIAIALASEPRVLLCDEPTTALDVTVQAQIVQLLLSLRKRLQLAVIYVSHDLAVASQICDTVAVMYAGRLVETGPLEAVFRQPRHVYTLSLLRSLPGIDGDKHALESIPGMPPDLRELPQGCAFASRCFLAARECREGAATLRRVEVGRSTACLRHEDCAAARDGSVRAANV